MKRCIVIGAGIGGLSAGAVLSNSGIDVTVLEAHVYPGGCAGTFYHQGYLFDAGATLAAGFYPDGPMERVATAANMEDWGFTHLEPAMVVHLPNDKRVIRWGDDRRHGERLRAFGPDAELFWRWQERTADLLWPLAVQSPPWPPQSLQNLRDLIEIGVGWLGRVKDNRSILNMIHDAGQTVSAHLDGSPHDLVQFIDAQLLISAQTTSRSANALFGAAALDLPRRGPVAPNGGIGTIAKKLATAIEKNGGRVQYRKQVDRIIFENDLPTGVETKRGEWYPGDIIIANLPPWNIHKLVTGQPLDEPEFRHSFPTDGWGAFTLYTGVNDVAIPKETPLHQQILAEEPFGEGNSVFLSISPPWDSSRAPAGRRAVTLSTHTAISPWWTLYYGDKRKYQKRKDDYTKKLLSVVSNVLPGFQHEIDLLLPGTPITFQRFTRRIQGWVGGFPQTSLFRARGPQLSKNLWMVGDSIFPGQSIPAVALGGFRVAKSILQDSEVVVQDRDRIEQEEPISPSSGQIKDFA